MKYATNYKTVFTLYLPGKTLEMTREGGGFVLLTLGVGVAAINTGNNLLYLVLAMCCSLIAVSGIQSEYSLRQIRVTGTIPPTLYSGDPTPLTLRVENEKKWIPSYSVHIEVPTDARWSMDGMLYLYQLPPRATVERTFMFTAHRRGRLEVPLCRVRTAFPFGFFVKTKTLELNLETLVFPQIRPVQLPTSSPGSGEGDGSPGPIGDDIYSLREFRPGDGVSSIHWKSSAKAGSLRVREFASGGDRSYTLVLHQPGGDGMEPSAEESLEDRITEIASLAYHLIRRGDDVRLKTDDHETPFGNSETHLENILRHLALVEEVSEPQTVS